MASESLWKAYVGRRVSVEGKGAGVLMYFGITAKSNGVRKCGVALDGENGKHDGKVNGQRYFICEPGHGIITAVENCTMLEKRTATGGKVLERRGKKSAGNRSAPTTPTQSPRARKIIPKSAPVSRGGGMNVIRRPPAPKFEVEDEEEEEEEDEEEEEEEEEQDDHGGDEPEDEQEEEIAEEEEEEIAEEEEAKEEQTEESVEDANLRAVKEKAEARMKELQAIRDKLAAAEKKAAAKKLEEEQEQEERKRQEDEQQEAERQRQAEEEEAERQRQQQEEEEREQERQRQAEEAAAAEAERQRQKAEAAQAEEQQRKEEEERRRLEAEEEERKRKEDEEAERKRQEAEEAERKRKEDEEAERKRKEAEAAAAHKEEEQSQAQASTTTTTTTTTTAAKPAADAPQEEKKIAQAVANYQKKKDDHVSLVKGDLLEVLDNSKNWWVVINMRSKEQGRAPSNFVKLLSNDVLEKARALTVNKDATAPQKAAPTPGSSQDVPQQQPTEVAAPAPEATPAVGEKIVEAKADFAGKQEKNQLSMKKGEQFTVVNDEKQWWVVRTMDGKEGKVPMNYMKKIAGY